jgi:hypothetical protein
MIQLRARSVPATGFVTRQARQSLVGWTGKPLDLRNDPHPDLLHSEEFYLAGDLRLDCATYLTIKRRIFERRLQRWQGIRKADTQQACKIDVNKASKLWAAFHEVGWLEARWVHSFLGSLP